MSYSQWTVYIIEIIGTIAFASSGAMVGIRKNMDIFGNLEHVIIKQQHNCLTDTVKYSGKFIPIEHEYLIIVKKDCPYIVPITTVNFTQRDMRKSTKTTWASVLAMILEHHNCDAKLRQELHRHPRMFKRTGNKICLATPT